LSEFQKNFLVRVGLNSETAANKSICNSRAGRENTRQQNFKQRSSGLTLKIKLQMLSSTKYFQVSICSGWTFNEYAPIANTFSLCVMLGSSANLKLSARNEQKKNNYN
jgi:hypothetical protein